MMQKYPPSHGVARYKISFFFIFWRHLVASKKMKQIIWKAIPDCTRDQSFKDFAQQENFPVFPSKFIRTYPTQKVVVK